MICNRRNSLEIPPWWGGKMRRNVQQFKRSFRGCRNVRKLKSEASSDLWRIQKKLPKPLPRAPPIPFPSILPAWAEACAAAIAAWEKKPRQSASNFYSEKMKSRNGLKMSANWADLGKKIKRLFFKKEVQRIANQAILFWESLDLECYQSRYME